MVIVTYVTYVTYGDCLQLILRKPFSKKNETITSSSLFLPAIDESSSQKNEGEFGQFVLCYYTSGGYLNETIILIHFLRVMSKI